MTEQEAMERARAAARSYLYSIEGHLNPEDHATNHFLEFAKHERSVAASKARAAAIAECADVAEALIAHSGINVQDSMRGIVQQIRLLARPAG